MLRESEQFGPLSKETERQLRRLDSMIDDQLTRMKQARMDELVNFIILSDHGMTYGANPAVNQHPYANFPFERYSVVILNKAL